MPIVDLATRRLPGPLAPDPGPMTPSDRRSGYIPSRGIGERFNLALLARFAPTNATAMTYG